MFDPFFLPGMFIGLFFFAILLWIEGKRVTPKASPLIVSAVLAIPATWGLFNCVLMIAIILFGQGMDLAGFNRVAAISAFASIVLILMSYVLVVRRRRRRIAE